MAIVSNALQRNWRKKAGSYVFYKSGGQTYARERSGQMTNRQTSAQMIQRVVFATVTQAADKMLPIIGISQQGVTNEVESRRKWVSQNVKALREAALRMNAGGAVEAAFAPKGNQQLIPNSYIMSRGSLSIADALVPKTTAADGKSFGEAAFAPLGENLATIPSGSYTAFQLWSTVFGLQPGDQLTFPQIYGEGFAQTMLNGNGGVLDCTRYTQFVAPRIVLLSTLNDTAIEIDPSTPAAVIREKMMLAVDTDNTWYAVEDILTKIEFSSTEIIPGGGKIVDIPADYDELFAINNDDPLRAIGCIRSHKNASNGKWEYSNCKLVCVWSDDNRGGATSDYFGFTLLNAVDTYRANATTDSEGNFLQRGTDSNIVPAYSYLGREGNTSNGDDDGNDDGNDQG